eukprot:CAMPEP_0202686934 /NCGR_PEP_ID=MMETSP1385-20130828/2683_1 /ASSEMBLY_ACC=CAM_ASM_000861 /TAXON_ID=933848 /ORGANISM="Elphidium margaritaceum" /LENGTH=313 /DNA_ID=CAMNT_0049341615 /DNA_START=24 /DNA_END=965 /DNA_ORIENTATION=+
MASAAKSRGKSKAKAKTNGTKPTSMQKNISRNNGKTNKADVKKQSNLKPKPGKTKAAHAAGVNAVGRPKKSAHAANKKDKKQAATQSQKRRTREQGYRKKDIQSAKNRLSQRLSVKGNGSLLPENEWTPINYQPKPEKCSFLEEKDAYRGDYVDPDKDYIDPGKRKKLQPVMLERKKSKKAKSKADKKSNKKKQPKSPIDGADKAKPKKTGAGKVKAKSNTKSKQAPQSVQPVGGGGDENKQMSLLQGIQNAKLKKTNESNANGNGNGKLDMSKYQNLSHVSLNIYNQNRLEVEDVDASIKQQNHLKAVKVQG